MAVQYRIADSVEIRPIDSGQLMVETPTEKFVIVDKLGVVKATLDLIASGLDPQDALTGFPAEQKADAAERILEMLRQRKLIIAGNRSEKTVIDPIYPWLRHIAAADKASLHCAVVGDGLLAGIVTEELSEIGMKPFRCHANLDFTRCSGYEFCSGLFGSSQRSFTAKVEPDCRETQYCTSLCFTRPAHCLNRPIGAASRHCLLRMLLPPCSVKPQNHGT